MHWENKLFQSITIQNCVVWFHHCFLSSERRALAHRMVDCCVPICRIVIVVVMAAWCSITLDPLGKEVARGHTAFLWSVCITATHSPSTKLSRGVVVLLTHLLQHHFLLKTKIPSQKRKHYLAHIWISNCLWNSVCVLNAVCLTSGIILQLQAKLPVFCTSISDALWNRFLDFGLAIEKYWDLLFILQLEKSKMQTWLPPCLCID